ncbi:hypothetical protein DEU56DRAFT_758874 [Suillus clintonianus]|uniref:uncharacterized protein n=1 Tax=Suillus clintonianus TaxID=1904413 RepID=UPI001B85CEF9|nr:uncharacterized protein DEU56DRAFT_758874 [Suillus clintonianus]KAG2126510.1 hypothetical protein DEU56DRAFT_758874 [Suillus clintonianus]
MQFEVVLLSGISIGSAVKLVFEVLFGTPFGSAAFHTFFYAMLIAWNGFDKDYTSTSDPTNMLIPHVRARETLSTTMATSLNLPLMYLLHMSSKSVLLVQRWTVGFRLWHEEEVLLDFLANICPVMVGSGDLYKSTPYLVLQIRITGWGIVTCEVFDPDHASDVLPTFINRNLNSYFIMPTSAALQDMPKKRSELSVDLLVSPIPNRRTSVARV